MAVITGKNGGDTLTGGSSNDTITGGNGNDRIQSGDGSDSIDGGDGNDQINGYPTTDINYYFWTYAGTKTVNGGSGDDFIYGSNGDDSLTGGSGNDTLYGSLGNDIIFGGIGNDQLTAGEGNDSVIGGDGNDTLSGSAGNDLIEGNSGDDTIDRTADTGDDTVYGGAGNDLISYYLVSGNKTLAGDDGLDTIYGATGNDLISGGNGNDYLVGFAGNDILDGGQGNDTIHGSVGNDSISGGEGNDPDLDGGEGNDTIIGGNGNDTIWGFSGNDDLDGGNGNDTLFGGTGDDKYIGGLGDDYLSDSGGNNYYDAGLGNDTVFGDSGNDTVIAGDGNDSIIGLAGDDSLIGGIGDDDLSGGIGNDTLDGGTGDDELHGGAGNDTYYIDSTFDYVHDSGGIDTAYVSTSFVKLPSTIENVIYSDGAKALPYWISALLPDEAAGKQYATFLGESKSFGYIFPLTLPSYDTSTDNAKGFTPFSATQKARTLIALNYISTLLDVSFTENASASNLNTLSFASNNQTDSGGYASGPSNDFYGSDIFLDVDSINATLADGTFGAYTFIHEIGHALGLKHPFSNPQAGGGVADAPYLTGSEEKTKWTVMSYEYSSTEYFLRFSPLDIAALQYLYGPSKSARTGNDTYTISSASANFIWDGAGTDLIDASAASQSATIYLTPGYWGYLGTTRSPIITTAGQITVNFGSVIENLTGSAFADNLYGNEVGNWIEGGTGNDSIEGWDGADTLIGGSGNDTLFGGEGNDLIEGGDGTDTLTVSGISQNYTIRYDSTTLKYSINAKTGNEGKDTFSNIEFIRFSDKALQLSTIVLGTTFDGSNINETITGTLGGDTINGAGGIDTFIVTGSISDYIISYNRAKSSVNLTDRRNSSVDSLSSIEKLQFTDKTFDLNNPSFTSTPTYGKTPSFLFDSAYYLLKNPDLIPIVSISNAFDHYVKTGAAIGKAPNTWFDPVYYSNKWSDLKPLNLDAATLFMHYNLYGVWEGRSAGPTFDKYDGNRYLRENPDVAAYVDANVKDFLGSRVNGAIAHYIIYGANESRTGYDSNGQAIDQVILVGTPT